LRTTYGAAAVPGTLFIVATPIGNLGDLTPRIRESLASCHFVLVEDTRVSIKLFNHMDLKKRLISCHEHNENQRLEMLAQAAAENKTVALMSDAGTPLVSDPGYPIVQKAIELGMQVIPLPGPAALIVALVASGLPSDRFFFEGFLPDKQGVCAARLEKIKSYEHTLIFYVSPHKLVKTLDLMLETLGDRQACLARELTKRHEEFIRMPLSQMTTAAKSLEFKGECVLIVEGQTETAAVLASEEQLRQAIKIELAHGRGAKEISASMAPGSGWKKADIYRLVVECQQESPGQ
jgi:16S rRNA (cytidine1402-2'-O)-methyltransferase